MADKIGDPIGGSDNTRTRWGRRVPYLAPGMPLAAVLFVFLPWTTSFVTLAAVMFRYALAVDTVRPLAESMVLDFVPPERRSRANAAVKIATSLTIIVAVLAAVRLGRLQRRHPSPIL